MTKFIPFWKAFLCLIFIAFLSLTPGDDLPQNPLFNLPHLDKIVHFSMYLIFCLLLFNPLKKRINALIYAPVLSFITGGIFELLQQWLINNREGSIYDIFANLFGICFAFVIYKYILSENIIRKYL